MERLPWIVANGAGGAHEQVGNEEDDVCQHSRARVSRRAGKAMRGALPVGEGPEVYVCGALGHGAHARATPAGAGSTAAAAAAESGELGPGPSLTDLDLVADPAVLHPGIRHTAHSSHGLHGACVVQLVVPAPAHDPGHAHSSYGRDGVCAQSA